MSKKYKSQKDLFQLDPNIHYLNCSYMAPQLKTVEAAGITGVQRKNDPSKISSADFFDGQDRVRSLFADLVNCIPSQVAIIPSVSYGMANVVNNLPKDEGAKIITIDHVFPSTHYALEKVLAERGQHLEVVKSGRFWNERIINAIDERTIAVFISQVHWEDGFKFDLVNIGNICRKQGVKLIVDGTQSVGALEMDIDSFHVDALICGAYKWLMGPYSIGLAYYGPAFNEGRAIEENWMNRTNASDFSQLTNYDPNYLPDAGRYNVGESSNFILIPMLEAALTQVQKWSTAYIQEYTGQLLAPLIEYLEGSDYEIYGERERVNHILGLRLPEKVSKEKVLAAFKKANIYCSIRSDAIRISAHVYNDGRDVEELMKVLKVIV